MVRRVVTFLLLLISISCSHLPTNQHNINLSAVENLKIDETTMVQTEEIFGKPDISESLENGKVAWLYLEGKIPSTRLSLVFKNQKLLASNWFIDEGEKESDLSKIQDRYPSARFVKSEPEWTNSHAAPNYVIYSDAKLKLEVILQKSSNKVSAIGWGSEDDQESRKPAKVKYEF